jgi:hypothetical protein
MVLEIVEIREVSFGNKPGTMQVLEFVLVEVPNFQKPQA